MTVSGLSAIEEFITVCAGTEPDTEVSGVFCCDMLSLAMSKGKEDAAWVTVMGNVNTLAVLRLTGMSCVVLAEGILPDEAMQQKANEEGITVFRTGLPVFEAALRIRECLNASGDRTEEEP